MIGKIPGTVARRWRYFRSRLSNPVITQAQGTLIPGDADSTFVIVVGPEFDQTIPNAATTCRLGWARGFQQIGIPYVIVSIFDLAKRLRDLPNPVCWVSGSDYRFLHSENFQALKRSRHLVWVNPWFDGATSYYRAHGFENSSWTKNYCRKVLASEPSLVFTISPERSFEFYENWLRSGVRLVSLPLACDTDLYSSGAQHRPEFAKVEIAFVGGYWPYKARQFDRYLRPYEDRLSVFGYSAWPYAHYGGRLAEELETSLYRQAGVSPVINEPQVEVMGTEINERVFKVLGSAGLAITDVTPFYREWFNEDELLVPRSESDYHELMREAIRDDTIGTRYRLRGQQAVASRHTYAHRARTVLHVLGIQPPHRS